MFRLQAFQNAFTAGPRTQQDNPHAHNLHSVRITMAAAKRLQNDLMTLMSKPVSGISAFPCGDNMCEWTSTIIGPAGTPYVGLKLKLTMSFPPQYPLVPPVVLFKTPIYHPNVDFSGRICLDILKEQWSSVYSVETILLSLQSLLGEPNWYSSSSLRFVLGSTC